jgi:mono/diheme cytochrome c family protein
MNQLCTFFLNRTLDYWPIFFLVAFVFFSGCEKKYHDGEHIYKTVCANCHMDDGSGLVGLIPPVAAADFLKNNLSQLPCLIKNGISGPMMVNGKQYGGQAMPAMPYLTDVEITNLLNFLNTNFGNKNPVISLRDTKKQLENCQK